MTTENPIIEEAPAFDDLRKPVFPVWVRLGMLAAGALVAVVPVGGAVFADSASLGDEPPPLNPDDDIFHLMESLDMGLHMGLHLGHLINDGLTDAELATLQELLSADGDGASGPLAVDDLRGMSVGEIIRAGFAVDLHPRDIAAALLASQEEESFTTVNSPQTVASPTAVTSATVSPASLSADSDQTPATQGSATDLSTHGRHGHGEDHGSATADLPSPVSIPSPATSADDNDPASPDSVDSPPSISS